MWQFEVHSTEGNIRGQTTTMTTTDTTTLIIKSAGLNWTEYTYQKCTMTFWCVLYQMNGNRLKTSNSGRSEISITVKLITLINFNKSLTKTQTTDEKLSESTVNQFCQQRHNRAENTVQNVCKMLQHNCCVTCIVITVVAMVVVMIMMMTMMMMIQKTNRCDSKFKHSWISQTQTFSEMQSIPAQNLHCSHATCSAECWHNVNNM